MFLLSGDEVHELRDLRLADSVAFCVANPIEFTGKTKNPVEDNIVEFTSIFSWENLVEFEIETQHNSSNSLEGLIEFIGQLSDFVRKLFDKEIFELIGHTTDFIGEMIRSSLYSRYHEMHRSPSASSTKWAFQIGGHSRSDYLGIPDRIIFSVGIPDRFIY